MINRIWWRLCTPSYWSIAGRRLVVLTLPISLPVWVLLLILTAFLKGTLELFRPVQMLWNPPRRRGLGYYGRRSRVA